MDALLALQTAPAPTTPPLGSEDVTNKLSRNSKRKAKQKAHKLMALSLTPSISLTRQQVSHHAFNFSILDGTFEDTKFFIFSRRSASGVIDTPRALFANSLLMKKASSHFELLLNGNFVESRVTEMDAGFPSDKQPWTDDYDYDSDSDLEDYDDGEERIQEAGPSTNGSCVIDGVDNRHGVRDGSADSSLVQVASPAFLDTGDEAKKDGQLGPSSAASDKKMLGRVGKTVIIKDMAFNTWKAFIFYAYTGEISFAPLKSQAKFQFNQADAYSPPLCSPKSMYRLADKYGINDLKQLAANDIKSKLSADNILVEIFSRFTSCYSEIKDIQLDFFSTVSLQPAVMTSIPKWIDAVAAGDLPHSAGVVLAIIQKSVPLRTPKCPSCNSTSVRCNNCSRNFTLS